MGHGAMTIDVSRAPCMTQPATAVAAPEHDTAPG